MSLGRMGGVYATPDEPTPPSDTSRCCKHSMTARYCAKCARADLTTTHITRKAA